MPEQEEVAALKSEIDRISQVNSILLDTLQSAQVHLLRHRYAAEQVAQMPHGKMLEKVAKAMRLGETSGKFGDALHAAKDCS